MPLLAPHTHIGCYEIDAFVKDGEVNETYRVTCNGDSRGSMFMKLYIPERFTPEMKSAGGLIDEIELMRGYAHPFVISYIDDGIYEAPDGNKYPYLVTNYFNGRLLAEMLRYDSTPFTVDDIINIYIQMLTGLANLHSLGLVHNDITPRNVMYNPESKSIQIIDMGHIARARSYGHKYPTADLEPLYRSPEGYRNANDPAGDYYSAAAVTYALLTGRAPWYSEQIAAEKDEAKLKTAVHLARKKPLTFDGAPADTPAWLLDVLRASLALKPADRVPYEQICECLTNRKSPFDKPAQTPCPTDDNEGAKLGKAAGDNEPVRQKSAEPEQKIPGGDAKVKKGNGFADVAGMDELKDMLQRKVLFILKNREKAERYRLTPPNGMLLYGPPGCGKTYFAEKFAEESGFNYKFIKASDLGSIYVHGGQGKIAELFDKARQQAPVIICFDEFDAMVPDRSSRGGEHIAGEVNEFLSQLNNCSKDGIFVIGTTNQPEMIDRAILRKGRLDISVYIPEPDEETRRLMFDLYLKDRPCDKIDTVRLASLTEKYVASDIAFIVNDAAMFAAFRDEPITQASLEDSIKSTRPSLNDKMLRDYAASRQKLENRSDTDARPRVGFMQYS
ncbi:MAG: AAA family ATPase [Muribaculaceae bacterium]|nr:AAA family ATPase [Muribaculaceae bacterium]